MVAQKAVGKTKNKWSDQAWLMSNPRYWYSPGAAIKDESQAFLTSEYVRFNPDLRLEGTAVDAFLRLEGKEISLLKPYFKVEKLKDGKFLNYPVTTLQADIDKVAENKGKLDFVAIKSVDLKRGEKMIGETDYEPDFDDIGD